MSVKEVWERVWEQGGMNENFISIEFYLYYSMYLCHEMSAKTFVPVKVLIR